MSRLQLLTAGLSRTPRRPLYGHTGHGNKKIFSPLNILTPIIVQLDSIYRHPLSLPSFKTSNILIEFSITNIMKKCHQMSNGTKTYNRFANIQ